MYKNIMRCATNSIFSLNNFFFFCNLKNLVTILLNYASFIFLIIYFILIKQDSTKDNLKNIIIFFLLILRN